MSGWASCPVPAATPAFVSDKILPIESRIVIVSIPASSDWFVWMVLPTTLSLRREMILPSCLTITSFGTPSAPIEDDGYSYVVVVASLHVSESSRMDKVVR